jgi:tetratricopeptide (TPR) repeat protein
VNVSEKEQGIRQPAVPQNSDAAPTRLAVYEGPADTKNHLATITISKASDDKWTLQAGGPSDAGVDRVRPILDKFAQDRSDAARAIDESSPASALSEALRREGFIVEALPVGDYALDIQMGRNGLVLGTNNPLHELAPKNDDLGRRLVEALAKVMSRGFDELATEIDEHVAAGRHEEAALALKHSVDKRGLGQEPTKALLQSVNAIDVAKLAPDNRRLVRQARLEAAQRFQQHDVVASEAEAMLSEFGNTLSASERADLKNAVAIGAKMKGRTETALSIWRDLLKEPSDLTAEGRGWAWRNISMSLSPNDPELKDANRHSAAAFLQAGNKDEAGRSLMGLADVLMKEDPDAALATVDEIIALIDKTDPLGRFTAASAHHAKANRLSILHRHNEAYENAIEAVTLGRGLIGREAEFISSLHLAAIEARHVGVDAEAKAFEDEANTLTNDAAVAHFQLSRRVADLATNFNATEADALLRDAEAANNMEIVLAVQVSKANHDPSLSASQRLELLEHALERAKASASIPGARMAQPIQASIAMQLSRMGRHDRAADWYRKVLADNPWDLHAGGSLVNCLWETRQWGEAAMFLREQMELTGKKPGFLYAYGKSLFEAGDLSGAVTALTDALKLMEGDSQLKAAVTELRDRALNLGGTILPAARLPAATAPITREEFEAALREFGKFISSEKRMEFWDMGDKDYEWIASPERFAKNLLHTYLKARFGEQAEILDELVAGAGRLDLLVRLSGVLAVVIELKMCGFRYSTSYAAAGEDQIVHYMDNRNTHLGYLVVFDARLEKNGQRLLIPPSGQNSVFEQTIDVTPRISRRKQDGSAAL